MGGPLTLKQQRFVQELPLANSATEAAKRAGYSSRGQVPTVEASRQLRKANVAAAIQARAAQVERASIATEVERKEVLTKVLRDGQKGPYPIQAVIAASDQLNRMDSVYVDRSEVKSAVAVVLEVYHFGGRDSVDTLQLTESNAPPLPAYTPQKAKGRRKAQ